MIEAGTLGLLRAAAIALAAGAVSAVATAMLLQAPPTPPVHDATDEAFARIEALLEDWRPSLVDAAAARTTEASEAVTAIERTPVGSSAVELRLQQIEATLQRLDEALLTRPPNEPAPIARHTPINYAEIAALHASAQRDRTKAQQSTVFLTAQEVVRRFGYPDEIGPAGGNDDFFWKYAAPAGTSQGGMMIVFRNGYVAYHQLR